MKIEPTYVTFEQAKLLRSKGFDNKTLCFYFEDGEFKENILTETTGMDYGSEFTIEFSELIENWNDKFVTTKNGDRCFGCNKSNNYFETFSAPEQHIVTEWLRVVHGIDFNFTRLPLESVKASLKKVNGILKNYVIWISKQNRNPVAVSDSFYGDTPQEAYSTAFDYTLNNLI